MKKRNSQKFILIVFVLINSFAFCQQSTSEYVVITYEIDRNKDQHSAKNYYWIIPIDSLIGNNNFRKYPLYFDEFSKDDLKSCQENKDLILFTLLSGEDFDIDDKIKSDIKNLKKIVKDNRKKIERVVKKWSHGYKEKITIYATPIKGDFCFSNLSSKDEKLINYKGLVYIPNGNFSFNEPFLGTKKYRDIEYGDYLSNNYINSQ